uniref:Resistin n=1 Tax=Macaca mulatta TaxID=9544 RepID=A0A5F8A315_MACMU
MKALCLLLLPVLGLLVSSQTLCSMEEAVNEKIQEGASSLVFRAIRSIGLECQSVTSRGDLATCPRGECRSLLSRCPSLFQVPWECHLPTTFPMSSLYPARILVLTPSLLCPPSGHWCPPPLPASSAHSVVGASSRPRPHPPRPHPTLSLPAQSPSSSVPGCRLRRHQLHLWLRLWLVGCARRDHMSLPVRGHGLDRSALLSSAALRSRAARAQRWRRRLQVRTGCGGAGNKPGDDDDDGADLSPAWFL